MKSVSQESLEIRLRAHLEVLSQPRNPTLHKRAHKEVRDYLVAQLQSFGREFVLEEFPHESVSGWNVLSPPTGAEPDILVVAHYDTVDYSPGADDNGSAVAIALEVARNCPTAAILFPDLEEQGLSGARHFVSTGRWQGVPTLVLESVGYWTTEKESQSYPEVLPMAFPQQFQWLQEREFRGDFWALLYLAHEEHAAKSLEAHLSADCVLFPVAAQMLQMEQGSQLRDFGRSDHLAFWQAGRGALMLTDSANFRNPNYHRESDTPDTLDFGQMSKLCSDLLNFVGSCQQR